MRPNKKDLIDPYRRVEGAPDHDPEIPPPDIGAADEDLQEFLEEELSPMVRRANPDLPES